MKKFTQTLQEKQKNKVEMCENKTKSKQRKMEIQEKSGVSLRYKKKMLDPQHFQI